MPDWLWGLLILAFVFVAGEFLNRAEDRVKARRPVLPRRRRRDYYYN